jgi:hypothetical protein
VVCGLHRHLLRASTGRFVPVALEKRNSIIAYVLFLAWLMIVLMITMRCLVLVIVA